jgi:hypothetical protein
MIGRMVDGSVNPSWSDRLQLQADMMALAAHATAESRHYNRKRLLEKANAGKIEVGDRVMVRGQRVTPLTAKWDHHFVVTRIRGKVITVLHVPTGKKQRWNRNKIRLVDPEISWEGVRIRPRAQNIVRPSTSAFAGADRAGTQPMPLLPQPDEMLPLPALPRKRAAPDEQQPMQPLKRAVPDRPAKREAPPSKHSMQLRKRSRWDHEQMDVLSFCYHYFI